LRVIAIELLCGAQGLEFREGLRPGRAWPRRMTSSASACRGSKVTGRKSPDIEALSEMVRDGSLIKRVEEAVGPLEPAYAR